MKTSTTLAIVFLGLLSLLQLARVLLGWSVIVNGVSVPIWASDWTNPVTTTSVRRSYPGAPWDAAIRGEAGRTAPTSNAARILSDGCL